MEADKVSETLCSIGKVKMSNSEIQENPEIQEIPETNKVRR
jgi:hypothetical protein